MAALTGAVVGTSQSTDNEGALGNLTEGVSGAASGAGYYGVRGANSATSGVGVYGSAPLGFGVYGVTGTLSGNGVQGYNGATASSGFNAVAIYGYGPAGTGLFGRTDSSQAAANGVTGYATGGGISAAINGIQSGSGGYAGYFSGNVTVIGALTKSAGSFKIDHPLHPDTKYLSHSFVESPDMKDIYDGVIELDAGGSAVIQLPDWFEALNKDFRYQLTCIGQHAPVYVADEIRNNQFVIGGGKPGMRVSWQVTGTRHDQYADAHRIPVEEQKSKEEEGRYLHPELFHQPPDRGMAAARNGVASVSLYRPLAR